MTIHRQKITIASLQFLSWVALFFSAATVVHAAAITVSGTLYSDDGVTTESVVKTIKMAVGTSTVSVHSDLSDGSGSWSITLADGHGVVSGTPITAWVDGDSTYKASAVTVADSSTANISNFDLHKNAVLIQHESGISSTTIDDMANYTNADDTDIAFAALGAEDYLAVLNEQSLRVESGSTFLAPADMLLNNSLDNQGAMVSDMGDIITFDPPPDFEQVSYVDLLTGITPQDVTYNASGTKMYIANSDTDEILEYELATPYDGSTLIGLTTLDISTEETNVSGITFNTDGTKMFLVGTIGDDVNEYTLSVGFDLGSTVTHVDTYSVSSQESDPTGIAFNDDGTKMFIVGSNGDDVNEYTLSVGFDLSSTVTFIDSFSVTDSGTVPQDVEFNASGTEMFIIDSTTDYVQKYELSAAFDVSTATTSTQTLSFSAYESSPLGVAFNASGTRVYISGSAGDDVTVFDLAEPYNLSGVVELGTESFSGNEGFAFNASGTEMYMANPSTDLIYQYTLSTAFDVTTATLTGTTSVLAEEPSVRGVAISDDGLKLFIAGQTNNTVVEYDLSVAFDVSTATYSASTSISANAPSPADIQFNASGTVLMVAAQGGAVHQYTLSSGFDITTLSYASKSFNPTEIGAIYGMGFSENGETLVLAGTTPVYEYTLTTGFDLGSVTYSGRTVSASGYTTGALINNSGTQFLKLNSSGGVTYYSLGVANTFDGYAYNTEYALLVQPLTTSGGAFNADGTKLFWLDNNVDRVIEYSLSVANDVSTRAFSAQYDISNEEATPTGIAFNTAGTKMFIVGSSGDDVNEYTLSSGFDLSSTVTHVDTYSISSEETDPASISFNADGTKMFVSGNTGDDVNEYTLSSGFDLSSTVTFVDSFSVANELISGIDEVIFLDGGARMLFLDRNYIHVYDLSTTYDVSTAVFDASFSVPSSIDHDDIFATADEARVYIIDVFGSIRKINEFTVNNVNPVISGNFTGSSALGVIEFKEGAVILADNASTSEVIIASGVTLRASTTGAIDLSTTDDFINEGTFKSETATVYLTGTANTSVTPVINFVVGDYNLATEYDYTGEDSAMRDAVYSPDGTKLFTIGGTNDYVYEYDLTTPYDIASGNMTLSATTSVTTEASDPYGLTFSPDGTKMYVVGRSSDSVHQYNLSGAFDVTTASFATSTSLSAQDSSPSEIEFSGNGKTMLMFGAGADDVYEYSLSTAFDISTLSYVQSYSTPTTIGQGFAMGRNGTRLYAADTFGADDIEEVELASPYSLTSTTYVGRKDAESGHSNTVGMSVSSNDEHILVTDTNGTLYQYSLTTYELLNQHATGTFTTNSSFYNLVIDNTSANGTTSQSVIFTDDVTIDNQLTVTASSSVAFASSSTITTNDVSLAGSTASPVWLVATSTAGSWTFTVNGSQLTVSGVNVKGSNATEEIFALNSSDLGNNTNWSFVTSLAEPWNSTDWTLYDAITIDSTHIDSTLTDFPVYVNLADLSADFWSGVSATGTDIRVTTNDSSPTELPHELVFASTTAQTGELYFKADSISHLTDTVFRIYYNGTTSTGYAVGDTYGRNNVWSNEYLAVYHLQDGDSTDADFYTDSSGNGYNGTLTDADSDSAEVTGKLGQGFDFAGDADLIDLGVLTDTVEDNFTLMAWAEPDVTHGVDTESTSGTGGTSGQRYLLYPDQGGSNAGAGISMGTNGISVYEHGSAYMPSTLVWSNTDSNWQHVAIAYSSKQPTLYHNGTSTRTGLTSPRTSVYAMGDETAIGGGLHGYFDGAVDEVRYASTTRSAAWIKAVHANQSTSSDFYSVNAEKRWNSTDWTQSDAITIDSTHIDSTLTDFPVYVNLADLSADFWSGVSDDGEDIRVTTAGASPIELPREIVSISTTTETGELHFKANSISASSDTSFKIYYNGSTTVSYAGSATYGPQNVWSNDYVGVWHLGEEGNTSAGGYMDSTQFANHGTGTSMTTDSDVTGQLGKAQDFDGLADVIKIDRADELEPTDSVYISAWLQRDGAQGSFAMPVFYGPNSPAPYGVYGFSFNSASDTDLGFYMSSDSTLYNRTGSSLSDLTWSQFTGDYDGSTMRLYQDGSQVSETSLSISIGDYDTTGLGIGALYTTSNPYSGAVDEVRIASTSRSAAWISAAYENQASTTNFYSLAGLSTLTISDSSAGQVDNGFSFKNESDVPAFAFRLTPQSEDLDVTNVTLTLTGVSKNISASNLQNIRLYRDNDSDGELDPSDTAIDTSGVFSASDQQGSIDFDADFTVTAAADYLVVFDTYQITSRNSIIIDLVSTNVTGVGSLTGLTFLVTGDVSSIQHTRAGSGGGSTAQIGDPAPQGRATTTGGESGGGGEIDTNTGGATIGNDPGFFWPSANTGSWNNAANAYDQIDGTYATTSAANTNNFSSYSFGLPGANTITGIEVKLELSGTTAAGDVSVELSWDGGTSWTSSKTTATLSDTDTVVSLGGTGDTWGRTWTVAETSDANFAIRLTGNPSSNEIRVDAIQVKIFHQASGGGGGGGGSI